MLHKNENGTSYLSHVNKQKPVDYRTELKQLDSYITDAKRILQTLSRVEFDFTNHPKYQQLKVYEVSMLQEFLY